MKKTLKNILMTGALAAAMTFNSCSKPDDPTPEPNPEPTPVVNKAPTAYGTVNIDNGKANETDFIYSANGSTDPENKPMTYAVDVDGDGAVDTPWTSTNNNTSYKYNSAVNANPAIQVKDDKGLTDTYSLGKVGVWETDADKPQVTISAQNYVIAGKPMNIGVEVTEPSGLSTENDLFYGSQNKGDIGSGTTITPTEDMIGSDLESRVRATTPYHIEGETTKTTKVGSPIPYNWIFTDKATGIEYEAGAHNGLVWVHRNHEVAEGKYYDNNPENKIFGSYLTAAEVDALEDVVFTLPDGREFETHVASAEEWGNLRDHYGGITDAGGKIKYEHFASEENVGTFDSAFSAMPGGATNNAVGFDRLGVSGYFMTSTDNGQGSKKAYIVDANSTSLRLANSFTSDTAANVRLIVEPHQN